MSSTIARYLPGKRKASSTSSASEACVSPEPIESKGKEKQEKKKLRQDSGDSVNDSMELQETLDEIKTELIAARKDIKELQENMNTQTARLDVRIEQLESIIFEMRNERDVLAAEVKTLREENKELQNQFDQCVKEGQKLKTELNDQEQHGRQSNLRVYGVPERRGDKETVDQCVDQCVGIFTSKVGVSVSKADIEIAHRTGKPGGPRPRPIIVRFHSRRVRGMVLEKRRNLKQSGVSIGEDLTQLNYKLLTKANQHSATLAAWSSNGKVLAKLKNGKLVKLDINMNIENVFDKEMK